MSDDRHFNANKVFFWLFLLTGLEVGWGLLGGAEGYGWNKLMLWGGLLFFAFWKGWLIAVYFMHLKFEGWVVKSLILPTPFLVMVIMGYVMGDVTNDNGKLNHPIGSMVDPETGVVFEDLHEIWEAPGQGAGDEEGGDAGH